MAQGHTPKKSVDGGCIPPASSGPSPTAHVPQPSSSGVGDMETVAVRALSGRSKARQHLPSGTVLTTPAPCPLQGTTLVQELLEADFKGLICIRSANTSEQDTKKYRRSGAHCVLGKELSMALAINMMKAEYVRHGRRARLASSPLVEWDLSLPGSSSTPLTADQSVFEPYSQTSEPSQAGASSRDRAGSCEA